MLDSQECSIGSHHHIRWHGMAFILIVIFPLLPALASSVDKTPASSAVSINKLVCYEDGRLTPLPNGLSFQALYFTAGQYHCLRRYSVPNRVSQTIRHPSKTGRFLLICRSETLMKFLIGTRA
jgi:hypothetical protein